MNKINLFRTLLVIQIVGVAAYTYLAIRTDGVDLIQIFLTNIQSLGWSGQFNLDFLCYLMLSGLWIMWRSRFSGMSLLLGSLAMILGIVFFAPYLLWCVYQAKGNMAQVLLGLRFESRPNKI